MPAYSPSVETFTGGMDRDAVMSDDDYIPVSGHAFVSLGGFPCDLLLPVTTGTGEVELKEIIKEGQPFDESVRRFLDRDVPQLYARDEDENKILEFLRAGIDHTFVSGNLSVREKCRIVYCLAECVVRKVFRERPTSDNVALGREVAANISFLLSLGKVVPGDFTGAFSPDYHVFSHCARVAALGMTFCRYLELPKEQVLDFGMGALFHDIGKSSMESKLLTDSSRWDIEDFEVLKRHAVVGYQRILSTGSMTESQLDVVLHHHEAHDGSGYPDGLKGDRIGELSRIARIVDVYDSITTRRHKKALHPSDAVARMNGDMKGTFDPVLLKSFIEFLGMEEEMTGTMNGKHINLEMGSRMHIQLGGDIQFKSVLVGIDAQESIILRSPASAQIRSELYEGRPIIVKCVQSGSVYGFRSKVLCNVLHPNVRMLVISYPSKIESVNLRKHPRICCYLPVEISTEEARHSGIIIDLSMGGCRMVTKFSSMNNRLRARINAGVNLHIPMFGDDDSALFSGEIKNMDINECSAKMGIRFTDLSEQNKRNLEQFIGSILDVVSNDLTVSRVSGMQS